MNILNEIKSASQKDLLKKKRLIPLCELEKAVKSVEMPPDFVTPFLNRNRINIIAELKKASPSKGLLRNDFSAAQLAVDLEKNGAAALSVLTECNFFEGSLENLRTVKSAVKIPLLRKDFIYDVYQIMEAKLYGASAVLLIAAMLDYVKYQELLSVAHDLGLSVLGEAHNNYELERILASSTDLIGVNARNLHSFECDLKVSERLIEQIPANRPVIAESSIKNKSDVLKLQNAGASGFLIGETLMRAEFPGRKLLELL